MSATPYSKYITDPIHDSIGLTEVEVKLIGTAAFQRLRGVKHLGLVHLVYPGADFSRFSHSLGVCHVTGQILDSLHSYHSVGITAEERQLYRLAALLHDIGHYPFSHPMEQALEPYYQNKAADLVVVSNTSPATSVGQGNPYISHEEISELIVTSDPQVSNIIRESGIAPEDVAAIFRRTNPPQFANLVSSDLDADRIDYMLRTAVHAGLPYGRVDIEYLVRQLRLDDSEPRKLCLPAKALRAAEHFLMARFFEYCQVLVHKTVAGMEQVLKDAIAGLLQLEKLRCDRSTVTERVLGGKWSDFDDSHLWEQFKSQLTDDLPDPILKRRLECLVQRHPPYLVGEVEFFEHPDLKDYRKLIGNAFNNAIPALSEHLGIDQKYFFLWENSKGITKAPASLRYSQSIKGEADLEKLIQVVHILPSGSDVAIPITECNYSTMKLFVERPHYLMRLYLIEPEGLSYDRKDLSQRLKALVPAENIWK